MAQWVTVVDTSPFSNISYTQLFTYSSILHTIFSFSNRPLPYVVPTVLYSLPSFGLVMDSFQNMNTLMPDVSHTCSIHWQYPCSSASIIHPFPSTLSLSLADLFPLSLSVHADTISYYEITPYTHAHTFFRSFVVAVTLMTVISYYRIILFPVPCSLDARSNHHTPDCLCIS